MLGRLAKWLRILGYDTVYRNDITREDAVTLSRTEDRILLTRDTHIAREGLPGLVFIQEDRFRDQIVEAVRKLDLRPREDRIFSLCIECNAPLRDASLGEVRAEVPGFVARTQTRFLRCPACRRVYWGGTHRRNMTAEIAALLRAPSGSLGGAEPEGEEKPSP